MLEMLKDLIKNFVFLFIITSLYMMEGKPHIGTLYIMCDLATEVTMIIEGGIYIYTIAATSLQKFASLPKFHVVVEL